MSACCAAKTKKCVVLPKGQNEKAKTKKIHVRTIALSTIAGGQIVALAAKRGRALRIASWQRYPPQKPAPARLRSQRCRLQRRYICRAAEGASSTATSTKGALTPSRSRPSPGVQILCLSTRRGPTCRTPRWQRSLPQNRHRSAGPAPWWSAPSTALSSAKP